MIAIVHSIYSQSVHAPALHAGLMDNDAERCCKYHYIFYSVKFSTLYKLQFNTIM